MDDLTLALDRAVPLQGPLGYLNFSEGKPAARFQKQISDAYEFLAKQGTTAPWQALGAALRARLETLAKESSAFRDSTQAQAVVHVVFDRLLAAYRVFHADLLAH